MARTIQTANNRPAGTRRPGAGFTAVEIAMVASVIAILALLILPIFRQRAEAARLAVVEDELASIAKVQLLIEADTNIQARLQDLDNVERDPASSPSSDVAPPIAAWNGTLGTSGLPAANTIQELWKGPYAAYKNHLVLGSDLSVQQQNLYVYPNSANKGFIYIDTANEDNWEEDKYPKDPWGQPYIFFGAGRFPAATGESVFNSSVIYSMGPDGSPGDGFFGTANAYSREAGVLGTGDDIEYRF